MIEEFRNYLLLRGYTLENDKYIKYLRNGNKVEIQIISDNEYPLIIINHRNKKGLLRDSFDLSIIDNLFFLQNDGTVRTYSKLILGKFGIYLLNKKSLPFILNV